jgi:murein DD-endopeptidase MepM/ murein hydrolase activator NlpD
MQLKLLPLLLLLFGSSVLKAQIYEKQEQVSFGHRINNPVTIEVVRNKNELIFYADNKSYYPYQLELQFNTFVNLSPLMTKAVELLHPGRNRLFKLTIPDPTRSPNYSYSIRYTMGDPREKPDEDFPYLLPLAPGKKMELYMVTSNNINYYYPNTYKVQPGDTIYAIRKGIVTSLPADREVDSIVKGSVEIRHSDGTMGVYTNLEPLVDYGQKIYPGQAIGVISQSDLFRITVYRFLDTRRLGPVELKFAVDESNQKSYKEIKGTIVQHPISIIEKEMTDKELKKFRKGALYTQGKH